MLATRTVHVRAAGLARPFSCCQLRSEMNKSFQAAAAYYKHAPKLTHQQEVMRLYRSCLRTLNSWAENRDLFNEQATLIRREFNANKHHKEPALITRIVREARERLAERKHPDQYITAYMPGGTLFMRNPAFPNEALYPDGVPEHVSRRRLNIDMSNVPDEQEYANPVFVDSVNKQYWIDK